MAPDDLFAAARPLVTRAAAALEHNPALAGEIAALARALAGWADRFAEPRSDAPPPNPVAPPPEPLPPEVRPPAPRPAEARPPDSHPRPAEVRPAESRPAPGGPSVYQLAEMLFPPPPPAPSTGAAALPVPAGPSGLGPVGLHVIARRARLKAAAARLAARRAAGAPSEADEGAVKAEAERIPDCALWMLFRDGDRKPKVWDDLAGAFEACAAAADLMDAYDRTPDPARTRLAPLVLPLAAEAQSTLRSAIADARQDWTDPDQIHLFVHVKEATKRERVYVSRYMRQEDWAKAENWADVVARVEKAAADVRAVGRIDKSRAKDLHNLAYKSKKLTDPANDDPAEWGRAIELIAGLVDRGLPPSSVELRDLVLPLFDRLAAWPDPLPPAVDLVLRETDRYLAAVPPPEPGADREPQWSAEVSEAADLLRGTAAVLIGGQVRPDRRAALERAFGLTHLEWVTTPEHTSTTFFEPYIARPDVVVVMLASRWANHDYQNVKDYCEAHGKLYVKLPAGYHPNQAAHQILEQVGKRLRAARPEAG